MVYTGTYYTKLPVVKNKIGYRKQSKNIDNNPKFGNVQCIHILFRIVIAILGTIFQTCWF